MTNAFPLTPVSGSTLHTTATFRVDDQAVLLDWLRSYPLATLVSADAVGRPRATVAPLLLRQLEEGLALFSHLDRRNPQVKNAADGRPFLVICQGPQAYVSPAWFARRPAAPTYLHLTAHVQAVPEVLEQPEAIEVLLDTVRAFESTRDGWIYDGGEQYLQAMSSGIVAFQLHVRGIEGVRKLSQNRDRGERSAIAARLAKSSSSTERAIAQLIEDELRAAGDRAGRP